MQTPYFISRQKEIHMWTQKIVTTIIKIADSTRKVLKYSSIPPNYTFNQQRLKHLGHKVHPFLIFDVGLADV